LLALARAPAAAAWSEVRLDPGAVLLLLRHSAATRAASSLSFFPALVQDPASAEAAVRLLDQPLAGFVDWSRPEAAPVYRASLTYAHLARALAERSERADPDNAWVAGLLAPLGWLAVAAIHPGHASACLTDPGFARAPTSTQQRCWGLDQAAITRRLGRRWRLPRWLAVVTGHLALPVETAKNLGADPDLFLVVQLAVSLAQQQGQPLRLGVGTTATEAAGALGLSGSDLEQVNGCCGKLLVPKESEDGVSRWARPDGVPLLRDLLVLAAENRRLNNRLVGAQLEQDVDDLQQALEGQLHGEAGRLEARKLSALAEFAAGAGHEINNPLAVISGQAQYLLSHLRAESIPRIEDRGSRIENGTLPLGDPRSATLDPRFSGWEKALQTIIGQTRRIHQLLADLMQFARPPRPQPQPVDVAALVREVAASLQDLAAQRGVRLVVELDREGGRQPPAVSLTPCLVSTDRGQVGTALTCLLRNAVEAAPADGWAGVRLEKPAGDLLELVIEDNGSGPSPAQREHLFDPFYSGRTAGRGRGLGLAMAWRLARENGGAVRFDGTPAGLTRFVLTLPRPPQAETRAPVTELAGQQGAA
jgi:signal transduction histidine kinase